MEEIETGSADTESGASEGSSTEASSTETETGSTVKAEDLKQQSETTPFHEHPRFKELVEQKNEALKRHQEMETRYKTIETQLNSLRDSQPKAPTETDQLIADLKKVDPRLANVIESQLKSAKTAEAVQARLEQFEQRAQESAKQQTISNAVSKINSLHEANKTSEFGKQFINSQLDISYRNGKLDASDLKAVETAYKEVSDSLKKAFEDAKREAAASYVQAKTKDASIPTSVPKGTQAKPAQKPVNPIKDKDALKSAVVKSFLKEQAAARDASNV